jgi:hypothetical protein
MSHACISYELSKIERSSYLSNGKIDKGIHEPLSKRITRTHVDNNDQFGIKIDEGIMTGQDAVGMTNLSKEACRLTHVLGVWRVGGNKTVGLETYSCPAGTLPSPPSSISFLLAKEVIHGGSLRHGQPGCDVLVGQRYNI